MHTYTNSFHNSLVRSRLSREEIEELERIEVTSICPEEVRRARRALDRIRKALCGITGCTCARNRIGER